MKDVLRAHGLPVARHALARSAADAFAFAEEVGYPLVVKPPEGAGAKATFRVDDEAALREATALFRPDASAPLLVEEFVTDEEHSFDAANVGRRTVWSSVSKYLPAPLDVLRNPWIQWCVLRPREQDDPRWDAIKDVAVRALAALGMDTGVSHMEWFRRRDGSPCISEVGARPPGAQFCTLLSHAHGVDFYRAWARLVVFEELDLPTPAYAAGAAYLRGQGTGRVRAIRGLDEAQKEVGDLVVEARLPREGQASSGTYEGEGYVILRHPDTATVERALRRLVSLVRVEMA
jgi:biotin carboxylase